MALSRRTAIRGLAAVSLTGCSPKNISRPLRLLAANSDTALWDQTVRRFLQDDLWSDIHAYDAGHVLMVPLHQAFLQDVDPAWGEDFQQHASRFGEYLDAGGALPKNRINRLQYLYLWTQFALLAKSAGREEMIPAGLPARIRDEHASLWSQVPAWHWDRDPFEGGIRERLAWKRQLTNPERSYHRAIIDEEKFVFAIGADLVALDQGDQDAHEAVEMADSLLLAEGTPQPDGGWLFQPGVMEDHPDYAYAGHEQASTGMVTKPRPGISGDTSHAHRWARWLRSLANVGGPEQRASLYTDIMDRLNHQFATKALVPPDDEFPGFRTTNFLDGHNGVYRWEYPTQGEGNGYVPFELSGTISLGWWSFLGTAEMQQMYGTMAASFPLQEKVIELYVGPNTMRERHPLVRLPDFYSNGFAELLSRLAARMQPVL